MKSDKYWIFCISIIKLPKKFTTIYSGHYNHGRNMTVIRDAKNHCFNFDWAKDADENWKH